MNREFKKTFFTCLMAVLLVVSNIIGMKLTNFMDITIGVDFLTYPFTFLCTLLIMNLGDKKDAYRSILVASVIQLLITISYAFASSLGTQTLMPDLSLYVNQLFKVNQLNILASVLAFIVSHCLLIYIYENFKYYGKELYGLAIGLLGSMFLNSVIFLVITLSDYEPIFVINMLLSNVIVDVIMLVIIIIMYYLLREPVTREVKIVSEPKKEVANNKKPISTKKNSVKKTVNRNTKTNNKSTTSKQKVKKIDKK